MLSRDRRVSKGPRSIGNVEGGIEVLLPHFLRLQTVVPAVAVAILWTIPAMSVLAQKEEPVTDITKVDADFAVQGEYVGELVGADGKAAKYGIQVVAQSPGKFRAYGHQGGLPGDGWDKSKKVEGDGQTKDGV